MMRSLILLLVVAATCAFQASVPARTASSALFVAQVPNAKEKGYTPKWTKKETIGGGDMADDAKGLKGNIPVVFTQGNETRTTMAIVGQPLSDVATQAGQFIKYACKKGECGTCECMSNGKWVRPCVDTVPATQLPGQTLKIKIKAIKSKTTSSGKFYSVKSFFMGFYNNLLGMVGFVKMRREAKQNFADRLEYEELIRTLTLEKRAERIEHEEAEEEMKRHRQSIDYSGLNPVLTQVITKTRTETSTTLKP